MQGNFVMLQMDDLRQVVTEIVEEVSDTFTDTTLKLNGVSDGMVSYSRVVRLLLQYYNGADKK